MADSLNEPSFRAALADLISQVKTRWSRWSTPKPGNFVPPKEVAGLSIGKFGFYLAVCLVDRISFSGSSRVVSNALNVDPTHLAVISIFSTILGFWFTLFRSQLVDNSHSREGRFRPLMKWFGMPTVLIAAAIVWFPFDRLPDAGQMGTGYAMKVVILTVLIIAMQFFSPIYAMGFRDIIMVMTPNSQERVVLNSVTTFFWGLAPTFYDALFNILSDTDAFPNGLADINLFRKAYLPVMFVGLALSYVGYFSVKERLVQSRAHYHQIKIREALRSVAKNKNFWLLSASGWAGFLEGNSNDLLFWAYQYQHRLTGLTYTIADMAARMSSIPSYVLAPILTKKFGKRAILIAANVLNILFIALTFGTFHNIFLLAVFRFLNLLINYTVDNISPALNGDVRDQQQYITGERIDGMFGMVGYIGSFIGMGTGLVTPRIQRAFGIFKDNGALDENGNPSMWAALKNQKTYDSMSKAMIVSSVVGAVMNVIPLFFYDLTESKQRAMIRVLKIRAMAEDYGNGILKPEDLAAGVEIIREAQAEAGSDSPSENTQYVLKELDKFNTPELMHQVALAEKIAAGGYQAIYDFVPVNLREVPKAEREFLRDMEAAHNSILRCYPDGTVTPPNLQRLEELYDTATTSREEDRRLRSEIKALEAERSMFHNSTKPYTKALQLLRERDDYANLDAIFAEYERRTK